MTTRSLTARGFKRQRRGWGAMLLLLAPSFVWAAEPVRQEKTFETTATPRISVYNPRGLVIVKGWDRFQVHVGWTNLSPQAVEIDPELMPASGPAEKVHLTTHVLDPKVNGNDQIVDYTLEVPVGSSIEVRNPQGTVRIEKIQGDTGVDSVGAPISVTDVAGHLALRSVGGDIEVIRPAGRVEASSITGSLHFIAPTGPEVRGNTTSGKITYEGDFEPGASYTLSAYSGDVDIFCPATTSFELSAKTVRGHLENALSVKPKIHQAFPRTAGSKSLFGTYNTGKATLEISSFSGTIRIRPQP